MVPWQGLRYPSGSRAVSCWDTREPWSSQGFCILSKWSEGLYKEIARDKEWEVLDPMSPTVQVIPKCGNANVCPTPYLTAG